MNFRMRCPTSPHARITQQFGENPQDYQPYGFPGHEGIDWGIPVGSEIYAVADGVISHIQLDGNTAPYGNYVRVQHQGGNYETIYAHLSQATVMVGQTVQAGQVIALSGNTGRSTGPHLHLTLKKKGATGAGETAYPKDVIDPGPYLEAFPPGVLPPPPTPPAQTTLNVQVMADDGLNLRSAPVVGNVLVTLPNGTMLGSLEAEHITRSKLGQDNQWLWVRAPDGQTGYVAAWLVSMPNLSFSFSTGQPGAPGGEGHRLQVKCPDDVLKLRQGPDVNQPILAYLPHATILESLEEPAVTLSKVDQYGQWLRVRTLAGQEGYVAAWYLRLPSELDERRPSQEGELPIGVSPHIFGIHAAQLSDDPGTKADIRRLYDGTNKKGWVLFTESIGSDPNISFSSEQRNGLWEWAEQGYGVIVRLNNSYSPGGTLPVSARYDGFAATCARFAEQCLRRDLPPERYTWTIQIGNEQNNPLEHPGGHESPIEHITPELYAAAFNKVYASMKAVLPNLIICPGAIDPYNYWSWKRVGPGSPPHTPLSYYRTMLANIKQLDGIVLHAYTHGPSIEAITSRNTFGRLGENPLHDHYYDFQTYRLFIEHIPPQWKHAPVYITEIDHIYSGHENNKCWVDDTRGWVSQVYAEVNRWNSTPQAQQVRAALLYRWTGDEWALENKPGVHRDFRQALANDYRWRQAPPQAVSFGMPRTRPEELRPAEADDLERILGVGPKIAALLAAVGLCTFRQIAALKPKQLQAVLAEGGRRGRYVDTWPKQARMLAKKQWKKLEAFQKEL